MRRGFRHPTQVIVGGFGAAVAVGTGLLALPVASADGEGAGLLTALFTATSSICLTGLAVVGTDTHWSVFGEVVIMLLIQTGGLGIMTLATLFALLLSGRLGLRARLLAATENKTLTGSDLRRVIRNVVIFSLATEAVLATILGLRFVLTYGYGAGSGAYLGVFHAVAAFNNGGIALWPDGVVRFASDPWICLPLCFGVIVGGLGFPVVFELARSWRRPARWSVLTKITVGMTALLLTGATAVFTVFEWDNPRTLGALEGGGKLLAGFFAGVMPRSGGFNSIDIAAMRPESWLATDILMFVGAGSAGTGGGIKVTTFGLLAFVLLAELRGDTSVNVGNRRIPQDTQRQALTIALIGVGVVATATFTLLVIVPHTLDQVLFEVISAFATVGLSTGITSSLPAAGQLIIIFLMFIGRVGPVTLFTALALRERTRLYELPEERPIVG
ncbi:TrkH family potassium uptake protein [Actinocorallia sp. API 0066]|uniref:TrkH family potassium uptake protein n=1 Tax=Actinocorallia sp. API 0066 TaxID=2896846 RepID=UPI001E4C1082|nr:potassium transporter TrkG [Actinocorallia sp. API 0066]MCD0453367.1 TrkH family potassium uptake protein [Actinocorallia sp. API 0066]